MPSGIVTVYLHPCFIACGNWRKSQWSHSLVSVWSVFIGFDFRQTFTGWTVAKLLSSLEVMRQILAFCASAVFSRSPKTTSVSSPSEKEWPR